MQNHVVTLTVSLIALAFYFAGYSGVGNIAFIAGGLFELWFWVRLLSENAPTSTKSPDTR